MAKTVTVYGYVGRETEVCGSSVTVSALLHGLVLIFVTNKVNKDENGHFLDKNSQTY